MGSFLGHVVPGSFFVIFGFWFLVENARFYFRTQASRPRIQSFRSQVTFPVTLCRGRKVNLLAWSVLLSTTIGIIIEVFLAPAFRHSSIGYGNLQHATMYFFFGMVGLQALVFGRLKMCVLHDTLGHISLGLAYTIEGVLFLHHLGGRTSFDVGLHTWLVYSVFGCALCTFLGLWERESLILSLGMCFFTLLQGTWFIQVAFLLYNPLTNPWNEKMQHAKSTDAMTTHMANQSESDPHKEDHENMMKTALIFSWHVGALFILMITFMTGLQYRYKGRPLIKRTNNNTDESALQLLVDEEEEDEH